MYEGKIQLSKLGLARLIEISVNRSIYNRKTIIDMKGLGSQRGEIGPAIEMHTDLKYVYMVYFNERNRNFICLVLKL